MTSPHLNKKEAVRGIAAYLGANYGVTWANEKVASEVCDYVAGQLQGPDTLPESGLHPESALKIAQMIVKAHETLKPKGLIGEPDSLRKTAAGWSVADLAVATARFDMEHLSKQADAMIMSGGQHTNRPGESPESIAKLDQHNRPQGEYLVGMGNTDMKASGPAILGKEQPHPHAPSNTSPTPNSLLEQSKAASVADMAGKAVNAVKDVGSKAMDVAKQVPQQAMGAAQKAMGAAQEAPGDLMSLLHGLSPEARGALMGGGIGAAAGGVGGAAMDEDNRLRGGLMGALGGGALGAGAGALYQHGMPGGGAFPGSSAAGHSSYVAPGHLQAMADEAMMANKYSSDQQMANILKSAQEIGLSNEQTVALLNKVAAGGTLTDSKPNTAEDAAKHDQVAKLDQKNRSTDKYLEGMGKTEMPNVGRVEHAAKRPDQPGGKEKSPDTTPSRETKSAADQAAETAFKLLFSKTAEAVGQHLPTHMDQQTKIGHVRMMMGMSESERANYLKSLSGQAA